ncbi:chorismate mutase [Streptomyces sp. NPDC056160]|uniref:chorismate mutase n=1 Tax=Streptomyces sp. NPDC056160 TaxID=3345731 RepID=UPI0035D72EBF
MTAPAAEKTGTRATAAQNTGTAAGTAEKTGTAATAANHTDTATTAAERTGARTEEAVSVITDARERIDTLDDRILGLVQERMAVSAVVQEARIGSGGRRVNLSREMEVLGRYRDALGRPGTALAMTLLELCRGKI